MIERVFRFLSSLKLAVLVLLGLAASLATGTILESLYDTATARYWVYRSAWFHGLLALLGTNIICSAASRYPFKRRHIPFLLAHTGIVILLAGSLITERYGLDGSMRVTEGDTASVVEVDQPQLVLAENDRIRTIPIAWVPPGVAFRPFNVSSYGAPYDVTVDQFLPHADAQYSFVPAEIPAGHEKFSGALPALHLQVSGGPMRIVQDFWLWAGDPSFSDMQAGPARLVLRGDARKNVDVRPHQPTLVVREKSGVVSYVAYASDGTSVRGSVPVNRLPGTVIDPHWRGVKITLQYWVANAAPRATYQPSRALYGEQAPPSAIHLRAGGSGSWLGLGDHATLKLGGHELEVLYSPQRVVLPFSVRLDHFKVDHYEGTLDPSAYSSRVTVIGGTPARELKDVTISMNEPLTQDGVTLYQASYEQAQPRPITSIFAVNRDPGRKMKYLGSILIVLGTIVLFATRYLGRTK